MKVVQIAILQKHNGYLVALCDDGSLWMLADGQWIKLPPIPENTA